MNRFTLIFVVSGLLCGPGVWAEDAIQTKAIHVLVDKCVHALNAKDVKEFGAVFKESGEFTNPGGMTAKGRAAIEQFHASLFSENNKPSLLMPISRCSAARFASSGPMLLLPTVFFYVPILAREIGFRSRLRNQLYGGTLLFAATALPGWLRQGRSGESQSQEGPPFESPSHFAGNPPKSNAGRFVCDCWGDLQLKIASS